MLIAITEAGWYLIGASALFLLVFTVFLLFYYKVQIRQNNYMLKEEQMRFEYQEQLLKTQLEIQEQTLKTISQEIHDNIGQALTLAKLNLNTMLPVEDDLLEQKIINSKELVSKAITDLRDLSHSLDTDYVQEMGLQRAIEYELERIQKTGAASAVLEVDGNAYRLSKQKELILFRITQEAFTNSIKHAEPKSIRVNMNYTAEGLIMVISDDGKGMDLLEVTAPNAGVGTRNMQSRADMIGASISFNSSPGNGTSINIFLPHENNKDA
ncbi:histidine kinase [Terrimonas sp. NA20]|uniref:histidine kinase n=1 Tax=Terrimonas ginsenosidimutans TaxID=2908004 RepID=A0ABS9KNQ9_9BACT|nr:ATP-binding protein [Terrimonas ginsenosidimutans]MCG2613920.1 histidine kinase [Terrimonas ginsenosidimutans]